MDDVPYDFIDRVFTKFSSYHIEDFHRSLCVESTLQSPLWTEVARVYEKKVECYSVNIVASNDGGIYYEILPSHSTFEQFAAMDDRFIRIAGVTIATGLALSAENRITNQQEFIRFLCRFNVEDMDIEMAIGRDQEIAIILQEFMSNRLQLSSLAFSYSPAARNFFNYCTNSGALQNLSLYQICESHPPDFKDDIVAFVCRPNFETLDCYFDYLNVDCLKQIIAYWRSMEAPWTDACITLKSLKGSGELTSGFAAIFTPASKPGRYEETNGISRLHAQYMNPVIKMEFKAIS